MGGHGLDSSGPGQEHVMGCCEHGNEPLGSKKMWGISCLASQEEVS